MTNKPISNLHTTPEIGLRKFPSGSQGFDRYSKFSTNEPKKNKDYSSGSNKIRDLVYSIVNETRNKTFQAIWRELLLDREFYNNSSSLGHFLTSRSKQINTQVGEIVRIIDSLLGKYQKNIQLTTPDKSKKQYLDIANEIIYNIFKSKNLYEKIRLIFKSTLIDGISFSEVNSSTENILELPQIQPENAIWDMSVIDMSEYSTKASHFIYERIDSEANIRNTISIKGNDDIFKSNSTSLYISNTSKIMNLLHNGFIYLDDNQSNKFEIKKLTDINDERLDVLSKTEFPLSGLHRVTTAYIRKYIKDINSTEREVIVKAIFINGKIVSEKELDTHHIPIIASTLNLTQFAGTSNNYYPSITRPYRDEIIKIVNLENTLIDATLISSNGTVLVNESLLLKKENSNTTTEIRSNIVAVDGKKLAGDKEDIRNAAVQLQPASIEPNLFQFIDTRKQQLAASLGIVSLDSANMASGAEHEALRIEKEMQGIICYIEIFDKILKNFAEILFNRVKEIAQNNPLELIKFTSLPGDNDNIETSKNIITIAFDQLNNINIDAVESKDTDMFYVNQYLRLKRAVDITGEPLPVKTSTLLEMLGVDSILIDEIKSSEQILSDSKSAQQDIAVRKEEAEISEKNAETEERLARAYKLKIEAGLKPIEVAIEEKAINKNNKDNKDNKDKSKKEKK